MTHCLKAAFAHLMANRIYLPGFSNQVTLGKSEPIPIGEPAELEAPK